MKKKVFLIILTVVVVLTLVACGRTNPLKNTPSRETGKVYGFWRGLWDGLTVMFAFIGSLFSDRWNIYNVYNNGGWYNAGYLLGIITLLGSCSASLSYRAVIVYRHR
jgi:hypothetical protein